jgi:hypothetical protein
MTVKNDTSKLSGALKELDAQIKQSELAKRRLRHTTAMDEWAQQGIRESVLKEARELFGKVETL